MPEIKCHHGCSMSFGTDKWISTLTIDQIRYAREAMDKKIKAAEESPKRSATYTNGTQPEIRARGSP